MEEEPTSAKVLGDFKEGPLAGMRPSENGEQQVREGAVLTVLAL